MTKGMTLPPMARRADLRSFGVALSCLCLLLLTLLLGPSAALLSGGLLLGAVSLLILLFPHVAKLPYRMWNKAAKLYARLAQKIVLFLCYHLVFRLVSMARDRNRFRVAPSLSSGWTSLNPFPAAAYDSQYGGPDARSVQGSWMTALLSWGRRTDQLWTICLVPLFFIMANLDQEADVTPSTQIYTLF